MKTFETKEDRERHDFIHCLWYVFFTVQFSSSQVFCHTSDISIYQICMFMYVQSDALMILIPISNQITHPVWQMLVFSSNTTSSLYDFIVDLAYAVHYSLF